MIEEPKYEQGDWFDPLQIKGWTEPELEIEEDDRGMRVRLVMARETIGPLTLEEFILVEEGPGILKKNLENLIYSVYHQHSGD